MLVKGNQMYDNDGKGSMETICSSEGYRNDV